MIRDDEMPLSELLAYVAGVLAVVGNDTTRKTFNDLANLALAAPPASRGKLAEAVRGLQRHEMDGLECEWACVLWEPRDSSTFAFCRFPDEHGDELVSRARVLALIEGKKP